MLGMLKDKTYIPGEEEAMNLYHISYLHYTASSSLQREKSISSCSR